MTKGEDNAVAIVKAWIVKHGYSTGGGDNIGYLLTNLESQMWERVRRGAEPYVAKYPGPDPAAELGRLIEKAHAYWLSIGASGAEEPPQ